MSVVVPLYNEGRRIWHLAAHLEQLPGLAEAILVDASDDPASIDEVESFLLSQGINPLIRLVRSEYRGRAAQMNAGAACSRGAAIIFLHCDTRLPATASEAVRRALGDGASWGRFDLRLDAEGAIFRVIETMINLRSRARRLATGDQAMFVSRRAFEQVGGFSAIPLMEDVEISGRLKALGSPALVRNPVVTSARRWQQRGVVRTIALMWKLRLLYWLGVDPDRLAAMYGNAR